jgi:hypothetical protein
VTVLIRAAVRQALNLLRFRKGEKIEDINDAGITLFISMQHFYLSFFSQGYGEEISGYHCVDFDVIDYILIKYSALFTCTR